MSSRHERNQSSQINIAPLLVREKELATEHYHLLVGKDGTGVTRILSVVDFSEGELEQESFWQSVGLIPKPHFFRPYPTTPDAFVAASTTAFVVAIKRELDTADREFLIKHAITHIALGHVRQGDSMGHWDLLANLRSRKDLPYWDTQVLEHLNPETTADVPEIFFTQGLAEVASRLRSRELDPPHTSAALLLESYKDEVVEVPRALTERAQLFPHQARGVAELVARLRRFNTSVLADSVGLGKTRTTCAVIRMLRDSGSHQVSAILTPRKLERNWRKEMSVVGLREGHDVVLINKDIFKRKSVQDAASQLRGVGLVVVEEAHQDLRNPGSRFHRNLRDAVGLAPGLLVTATPWNNRRGDIFSILSPFVRPLPGAADGIFDCFKKGFRTGRKEFEESDEIFHQVYGSVVLQRTRRQLREMGDSGVFYAPREPKLDVLDYTRSQQTAFQTLLGVVESLRIPYFNPVRYLTAESDSEWRLSGTYRFFLLKRAESSMAALRLTLQNMRARAEALRDELNETKDSADDVARWLAGCYNISEEVIEETLDAVREGRLLSEQISRPRQRRALRLIEEARSKGSLRPLRRKLIADCNADIKLLDKVEREFSPLFDSDPKISTVIATIREYLAAGQKILLVSQFADTAFTVYKTLRTDAVVAGHGVGLVMSTAKGDESPVQADGKKATREEVIRRFAPQAWAQSEIEHGREKSTGSVPEAAELSVLVGTDTLSVGQNLQDARVIIHLDLTWNPMVLEQRIGRLDRPRHESDNSPIEIRYFVNLDLIEAELALKKRIDARLASTYQDTAFDDEILPGYFELIETMRKLRLSRASANDIAAEVESVLEELAVARPPDVSDVNVESRRRAIENLCDALLTHELPEPKPPIAVTCGVGQADPIEIAAELQFQSFDNNGNKVGRPSNHLVIANASNHIINSHLDDLPRMVEVVTRESNPSPQITQIIEQLRAFDREVQRFAEELRDESNRLREKRRKIREQIRPAWLSPLLGRIRSFLESLPEQQYEQFLSRYQVSDETMGAWLDTLARGVNTDEPEMIERLRILENSPARIIEDFGVLRELIAEETFITEEQPWQGVPVQLSFDNEPFVHRIEARITNVRINLPLKSA
jgi:superfamily II DNA or RNA helicase